MPQIPSRPFQPRADLAVTPLKSRERVTVNATAPLAILTVESSVALATCRGQSFTLDRSGLLIVPRGCRVSLSTPAVASRTAAVSLFGPLLAHVAETYKALGVDVTGLQRALGRLELLPRTIWVHELVHRYLFERITCGHTHNEATAFLETELLKEIYFLFRNRDSGADRANLVHQQASCVEKAVAHIEANLYRPCAIAQLAKKAGASESTLLRAFRRELGCSPAAYWRSRKLDEALVLLRAGNRSVGEVASHVGYENATAFAFAFRLRFGRPPSSFVPRTPVRAAP